MRWRSVSLRKLLVGGICLPLSALLVLVTLMARPFVRVYIFCVPLRIGPLITEAARHRQLVTSGRRLRRPVFIFRYYEDPLLCNRSLAKHLGEYANWKVLPRPVLLLAVIIARRFGISSLVEIRTPGAPYDDVFWHFKYECHPKFSQEESTAANLALKAMGIAPDKPLMAILTRDRSYFQTFTQNDEFMSRHDYRNCGIANYGAAIDFAWNQGFQSVRVGRASDNVLDYQPLGYFDYSVSSVRSDLVDLALAMRADFIVTCSSGLDTLYWLTGKPFVGVNLPWLDGKFSNYLVCMPKRMFCTEDGRLRELAVVDVTSSFFQHGLYGPEWKGSPIQMVENSAEEIRETIALALNLMLDESLLEERLKLVRPLWEEFSSRIEGSNLHADARVRKPQMALPDSVIRRFLNTDS